ncbi:MAG: hypothetical protein ABSC21_10975 [Terriglobia bacterium]|jgi:hypothetical protein
MGKNEIVDSFRRQLCHVYGYDEHVKFVGTRNPPPSAIEIKASLEPRDFLNFAIEDSIALEKERNRINCLGNCKRAIDSQVDRLIARLGFRLLARKQRWNVPRKIQFISEIGVVAPRILHHVNQLRNLLEHEFAPPSKQQVEDALDVATLFISYAELVKIPSMNWTLASKLSVRYDYDEMVFHFFEEDPSDLPESDLSPRVSLAYGEDGFQDFYDFLVKIVPLMERKHRFGEPSDAAAVRSDGATNGGSHDPSRVEPPVVAMKKSIRGKTAKEGVCEISGSSSGDNDS